MVTGTENETMNDMKLLEYLARYINHERHDKIQAKGNINDWTKL